MKKFISAVLSAAIILSSAYTGVYAEVTSTKYTIDAETKRISKVAPLTTVAGFKANITGATEVEVINVDGSVMEDTAYATENVLAKIDGELYKIDVKYGYEPIETTTLADGEEIYNLAANTMSVGGTSNLTKGGFVRLETYGKIGYGSDNVSPANTDTQTVKATKGTRGGEDVYVIENDSNNYTLLRSHYSSSNNYSTTLNSVKDTWSAGPVVTSFEFEADKLGNVSLYHNTPVRNADKNMTKGDSTMDGLFYGAEFTYVPSSIHFLEDGSVKLGGIHSNTYKSYRAPAQETDFTWEAGKKYNVSIVQRYLRGKREAYVDGVYVNGTKIFPNEKTVGHKDGRVALLSDGTFKIGTKSSSVTHGGDISSILIGTAPKAANENLTVYLSDVNVYGLAATSDFNAAITNQDITLANAENISVSESDAKITVSVAKTVAELKAEYKTVAMGIYNEDGTMVADDVDLATGMKVMVASFDGLQGKTYSLVATERLSDTPDTTVYAVSEETKTISGVAPLTTVKKFLANFKNGSIMQVLNVDGTVMADDAYATEYVSLKAPNGDIYTIDVKYGYEPIETTTLADGEEIYNLAANTMLVGETSNLTSGGFVRLETYGKIGYGSDNVSPANTETQTVKATKGTRGGEDVYVIENDSNNYTLLRSHYSASNNYSTNLNSIRDTWSSGPIITAFEFETDKLGNVSLYHNTPVRNADKTMTKGDATMESLFYGEEFTYVPSSIHFLEDGSVKLGGIHSNTYKSYRAPAQETDFTWEAGKKYNVSIVQRYLRGKREAYVDGVYVNGTKIFPNEKTVGHKDGRVALLSDGTFKIGTKSSSVTHGGDISSILIGTAPKTADENLTVYLSDVKVYGLAATSDFNAAITNQDIEIGSVGDITVSESDATIAALETMTVIDLKARYSDVIMGIYNADGTRADDMEGLSDGMIVKIASADGLQGKTYAIATQKSTPDSAVYTVDTDAKTVSNVSAFTKVKDFLANFTNGSMMEVVNIDESVMDAEAYATENVSVKAPSGELYTIVVKKNGYTPIKDSALADGTTLYDMAASNILLEKNADLDESSGFVKVEARSKIGYGSDNVASENDAAQTLKATKSSKNGKNVYIIENDSNNYAYLRSHSTDSTNYSTALNSIKDTWTTSPFVTTVEFEADKLGNVSVFNNIPVRDGNKNITKGDSGIDAVVYGAELPYVPTSVHFLEDGTVKLGGMYSNYSKSYRAPAQETNFTWEPGKQYKVSIVQRYLRGTRDAYVDGVYVNGEKIFPNDKTVSHADGRVALQSDGTFKIGTKSSDLTYGGGISSIMVGTAPKNADENLTVALSDVKVYATDAYIPELDKQITITSNSLAVIVDNDAAIISSINGIVNLSDLVTDAKLKIEGNYVKAVSADGLVAKTYKIEAESIQKGFYNGENGPSIKDLAEAGDSICFNVNVDATSLMDGISPVVILAIYDDNGNLAECTFSTGTKYSNEVTNYKPVIDISGYDKSKIEVRGFIWDGFDDMNPLAEISVLK